VQLGGSNRITAKEKKKTKLEMLARERKREA
jgi:hypothetical protein